MSINHWSHVHCDSGPTLKLVIEYEPSQFPPRKTPKELFQLIQDTGMETGFMLHFKDCDVEWNSLNYEVYYNESKKNLLHLTIDISWTCAKTELEDEKKVKDCVQKCVTDAFNVTFKENGTGTMQFEFNV